MFLLVPYALSPKKMQLPSDLDVLSFPSLSREEENLKLSADLEKQQKAASRKSYTDRIKEITKNTRKQDADIERILKDTREIQLESNSIRERLHRTYAVADEIVFRYGSYIPIQILLIIMHRQEKRNEIEIYLAIRRVRWRENILLVILLLNQR